MAITHRTEQVAIHIVLKNCPLHSVEPHLDGRPGDYGCSDFGKWFNRYTQGSCVKGICGDGFFLVIYIYMCAYIYIYTIRIVESFSGDSESKTAMGHDNIKQVYIYIYVNEGHLCYLDNLGHIHIYIYNYIYIHSDL